MRPIREHCWDCGAGVGQVHDDGCDQAVCLATGGQRLLCAGEGADHDGDCGADVWSGWTSGEAECAEFGWWVQDRGREGLGFVPCTPDAPGAIPNRSRLVLDAVWDRAAGRWQRRDSTPPSTPWLPSIPPDDDVDAFEMPQEDTVAGETAHETTTGQRAGETTGETDETGPRGELIEAPRIQPAETENENESAVRAETSPGVRQRLWDLAIGELPSVWSAPPTEPAALVRYAADGAWCSPESVWLRRAGRVYCAVVAIPASVVLYVAAWLTQRPGRLAAAALLALIVGIVL